MKKLTIILFTVFLFSLSINAQTEKAVALGAGEYWFAQFPVNGYQDISGRFRARGGSGNDVEVYILDTDGFENWVNGHSTPTFYNSGRKTVGNFNVRPPAGNYVLVISNKFSAFSSKAVTLTLY